MRITDTCLMTFCAAHNDPIFSTFDHTKKHISVGLGMRRKFSVPLGICHGSINNEIIFLAIFQKF